MIEYKKKSISMLISRRNYRVIIIMTGICVTIVLMACQYWRLSPLALIVNVTRVGASYYFSLIYREDMAKVDEMVATYYRGEQRVQGIKLEMNNCEIKQKLPQFSWIDSPGSRKTKPNVPFVYDDPFSDYLGILRQENNLMAIAYAGKDEYQSMLLIAKWVGTRWAHGLGALPNEGKYDPSAILAKAATGTPYWCEISSILMVQAATAMGWPARLVTASRNGYNWEHAVAELWSNQYNKWFVVDTDYNVTYQSQGKPLSAFELCHFGLKLNEDGRLNVIQIAPLKKGITPQNLLPYYAYIHIDLRNDWKTRKQRRGSPAGGDIATFWTARPNIGPLLTAKVRQDQAQIFDWQVNWVDIICNRLSKGMQTKYILEMSIIGYIPFFEGVEIAFDGGEWKAANTKNISWEIDKGHHCLRVRSVMPFGWRGPIKELCYEYALQSQRQSICNSPLLERKEDVFVN